MRRCGLDTGDDTAAGVGVHALTAVAGSGSDCEPDVDPRVYAWLAAAAVAGLAVAFVEQGGLWGFAFVAAAAAAAAGGGLWAVRNAAAGGEIARLREEISHLRQESRRIGAETVLLAEINRRLKPRVETLDRRRRLPQPEIMPATAHDLLSQIDESRATPGRVETLRAVFDRVDTASELSYRERMDALVDILDMLDRLDAVETV